MSAAQLATFALEDNGRTYTISTSGVRWRRRDCLVPWMTGRTGTKVSVRHLPHHDDTIEVFDAATARHLGAASSRSRWSSPTVRSPCRTQPGRGRTPSRGPDSSAELR
ncbi:Mu transposase C-terminal domain-containing protein [Streptomyces sp. NPDC127168]|uniref:Mu transposase C-terminal domain-containing protein n=1 Tax=unclassified Streptomyces TaxID=2593676 RepID=UPI003644EAF4